MTAQTDDRFRALGEAVKARRALLRLKQGDLARRGGPSEGTVKNIEQAAREAYAPRTYAQLERALEWRPNTVERVLAGTATDEDLAIRWVQAGSEGTTLVQVDTTGLALALPVTASQWERRYGQRQGAAHADLGALNANAGTAAALATAHDATVKVTDGVVISDSVQIAKYPNLLGMRMAVLDAMNALGAGAAGPDGSPAVEEALAAVERAYEIIGEEMRRRPMGFPHGTIPTPESE